VAHGFPQGWTTTAVNVGTVLDSDTGVVETTSVELAGPITTEFMYAYLHIICMRVPDEAFTPPA
jgi:hypothetical protein